MMETEILNIWLKFGGLIHQDFLSEYPNPFIGFVETFNGFSVSHRKELYCFLVEIVSAGHTPGELADIWYRSGTTLGLPADEMPSFFSRLVNLFAEALNKSGVEIPPCS